MNKDKISIIVPVYNVEKFIKRNIESLLKQTYSNYEIIYVDDGSTDNCLNILEKYKAKDNKVKIIHTDNYGVSHARNIGINHATGRYITFVDGDDYVDKDYLEYLLSLVKKDDLKIGIALYHHLNDEKDQKDSILYDVRDSYEIIKNIYMNNIYMAVWNKIYDINLIKDNNIEFDESIWYAEGMHFNIQCLSCTDKVATGNKKVYHYIFNPNSAMRKGFKLENEKCALKSLDLQRKIINDSGVAKCYELEFHYMMVQYMICNGLISNGLMQEHIKDYNESLKGIHKRLFVPLHVNLSLKEKLMWLCIGLFPKYMIKRNIRRNR